MKLPFFALSFRHRSGYTPETCHGRQLSPACFAGLLRTRKRSTNEWDIPAFSSIPVGEPAARLRAFQSKRGISIRHQKRSEHMASTSSPNRGSDRDAGITTGTDQPGTFWEPGSRTGRDVSQSPEPGKQPSEEESTRSPQPDEEAQKELNKGERDREERNENAF